MAILYFYQLPVICILDLQLYLVINLLYQIKSQKPSFDLPIKPIYQKNILLDFTYSAIYLARYLS